MSSTPLTVVDPQQAASVNSLCNTVDQQLARVRDVAIQQLLTFYSAKGDVQTCVTVVRSLGDLGEELFSARQRKQWLIGYIGRLPCLLVVCRATFVTEACACVTVHQICFTGCSCGAVRRWSSRGPTMRTFVA
jgi:hypothetical protein